jgi:hypothetical protein
MAKLGFEKEGAYRLPITGRGWAGKAPWQQHQFNGVSTGAGQDHLALHQKTVHVDRMSSARSEAPEPFLLDLHPE